MLGNVVDVEFTPETLPKINDALRVRVNEDTHATGSGQAANGATPAANSAAPRCRRAI